MLLTKIVIYLVKISHTSTISDNFEERRALKDNRGFGTEAPKETSTVIRMQTNLVIL